MSIELGKYQHYKGQLYEVLGVALHAKTREALVIYKMLYATTDFPYGSLWVRPKAMFLEKVISKGEEVPRFMFTNE